MSLIKCKECGHEVSTFAKDCPHCGCPVSVSTGTTPTNSCDKESKNQKFDVVLTYIGSGHILETIRFIREANGIGLKEAKDITDNLPQIIIHGVSNDIACAAVEKLRSIRCEANILESVGNENTSDEADIKSSFLFRKEDGSLVCPKCGSSAVTTGTRGYSLVWGFIGSNKTTNRCGKCGYTWEP